MKRKGKGKGREKEKKISSEEPECKQEVADRKGRSEEDGLRDKEARAI